MLKRLTKIISMGVFIVMSMGLFVGCSDYGYEFHYDIVGQNGDLTVEPDTLISNSNLCTEVPWCTLSCSESSHVITLLGGKNGYRELKFIALPDTGFQVKEWKFNGEIVLGNKSNLMLAKVSSDDRYRGIVSVEFESISNEQ